MVTHVNERAVVWVVPKEEEPDTLTVITTGCLECRELETEPSPRLLGKYRGNLDSKLRKLCHLPFGDTKAQERFTQV